MINSTFTPASHLHRPFATKSNGYSLLHQHGACSLISRYPPAQYKTTGGAQVTFGGAEFSKQIYDKYYEIKYRDA